MAQLNTEDEIAQINRLFTIHSSHLEDSDFEEEPESDEDIPFRWF